MSELKSSAKPFEISKWQVWQAYEKVKANKGAPGVDGVDLAAFEEDLKNNLFKIWNRMSSGSYFRLRRVGWRSRNRMAAAPESSVCRRRWHSHRSCGDDLGFAIVTHPFHPLNGRRLEVLFVKRRGAESVFVCAGGVVGVQVTMPWSWTDRGEPPRPNRLSIEGLADLSTATRAIQGC